ncbi:glycosyltransferase family 2 protein [Leucobacter weissii]|uniref:Glycosyltransferase family 2 protein n=1 Tax=Leucobacter weissii TaxID=1983706 RepID=A0A939MKQ7_9MICO|nr:glycosyltransferase family 2 protein [Leucobacter weissii]MBO1900617.1 glycosyltransferase family 2 protein [Leucobacter weissii]
MRSTIVTAVVVAREGGDWLEQTIEALSRQTRPADRIIAVVTGGSDPTAQQLVRGGAQRVVTTNGALPFGAAVRLGVAAIPGLEAEHDGDRVEADGGESGRGDVAPEHEWLWLLSEDAAPEPEALQRILATVQRAPSVAVAGPKLVDWDRPEHIIELGQSLTRSGERWLLRRQELDQQQYDHLQDVLGVGPVGMLVRRDVWDELGGFDPALPVFDDGLDLSVRARLAGYRVVVAPGSRIRFAQSGIAGPRIDRSRAVMRTAHRQGRAADLRRRIAYAPAILALPMWLGLPLLGVARVLWALIREHPGRMVGEFAAALGVFFTPARIIASRRRIKAVNRAGWSAVRPLRVDPKSVRTARMIDREAILAAQGRRFHELHFISSGGLAVLVAAAVLAAILCWWAFAQTSLSGGGLAPLSPLGELWQHTRAQGGVPADPFTWVLAVLGTLTFWNPSHAIVLLFIAAIPLSALGGWIWGAQLTESKAGRALVGLGWAVSPVLLGSLGAGRVTTLVLAVTLPWLLLAASRCRESWSWAGTASLLAAVALASAPVLIPAALVLLLAGLVSSLHGIARVLTTAIAPLILFAPKIVQAIGGSPLDLLLDPGITPVFRPGSVWQLLLGFPEFGLEGWAGIFDGLGLGGAPATLLVGVLLLPIVLLAALGLLTGRVLVTVLNALLGGLGLATALGSAQLRLLSEGPETVALWTGSGLALYWIGVLGLAAVGCTVLARAATPLVAVALTLALVAVAPLGARLLSGQTGLVPGDAQMPAIVQAAGASDPALRTLVLTAESDSAVRARLVTGSGWRLDQVRTADRTAEATAQDAWVAELVAALASTGASSVAADELAGHGIGFVLLGGGGSDAERAELQAVFDQNAALSGAGQTEHGLLWRVDAEGAPDEAADEGDASEPAGSEADGVASEPVDPAAEGNASAPVEGTTFSGYTVWWVQLAVLFGMLLLALPTGEVVERPERRRRGSRTPVLEETESGVAGADPGAAPDAEGGALGRAESAAVSHAESTGESADADEPAGGAGPAGADGPAGGAGTVLAGTAAGVDGAAGVAGPAALDDSADSAALDDPADSSDPHDAAGFDDRAESGEPAQVREGDDPLDPDGHGDPVPDTAEVPVVAAAEPAAPADESAARDEQGTRDEAEPLDAADDASGDVSDGSGAPREGGPR